MREELPPSWMWPFESELEIWFDDVEQQREERYGGSGSESADEAPMMQNELAKGRR